MSKEVKEIKEILNESDGYKFFKELVPYIDIYKVRIPLSTKYQNRDTPYSWKIISQADSVPTTTGFATTDQKIQNILAMRMSGFVFPGRESDGNLFIRPAWSGPTFRQTNPVISIGIKELENQAIIHNNGLRSHFMFNVFAPFENGLAVYDATAKNFNDGYFEFRNPIKYLDNITLQFGINFAPSDWWSYTIRGRVVQNSNPMQVYVEGYGNDIGDVTQERKWRILDFTTGDPVADSALIDTVNDFYDIPLYYATEPVQFDINLSTMTSTGSDLLVRLAAFDYDEQIFPLELICINDI